ncbi:hypothetical protein SESBI_32023 [Sesbania bispinosa]|nr:hypothetical protein SESBI_32023 [Sesbania bispinosa]
MTNTSKSKGKTPLRFSNRKRARRTKPEVVESRGSFDGEVIHTHTLTVKKKKPHIIEISSMDTGPEKDNNFDIDRNMEYEDDLNPINNEVRVILIHQKKAVPAFRDESFVEEKIDRTPKDEVERILQKLTQGGVGNTKKKSNESCKNKVFCSPVFAKTLGMVLVTTTTSSGYYLNARNNEEVKDTLIGEFVP